MIILVERYYYVLVQSFSLDNKWQRKNSNPALSRSSVHVPYLATELFTDVERAGLARFGSVEAYSMERSWK